MSWYLVLADRSVILLFIALGIFGYLALRSKNVRNFQFQVSIIILVWITSEIVKNMIEGNVLENVPIDLGMWIHLIAMAAISITFWLRYHISKKAGRRFIDELSS